MESDKGKMRKTLKRDLEMLELLSIAEKKAICQKYKIKMNTLNAWLHRVRTRRKNFRTYLNTVLSLEKRNPRLKKILLSASENDLDLIDDVSLLE